MERIKEIREKLKLSRREFSELYEIPYNTLAQWERGERIAPAYVVKLIEENIKLKSKGDHITIDQVQKIKRVYIRLHNGEIRYQFVNKEEAKKWANIYKTCKADQKNKVLEIEYIIRKEF